MQPTAYHPGTLTPDELARFERDGYLGPFTAFSPDAMAAMRAELDRDFFDQQPYQGRHLDLPLIYRLASAPAIIDRAADLFGGTCILWQTNFFVKPPGGREIPWHQDRNYWPIEPEINISAWMAIDKCDTANSCVQLIPGSHRVALAHHAPTHEVASGFHGAVDPAALGFEPTVVDMELEPGQFFLFTEKMLHHSNANLSDRRRAGMVVRLTVPQVRIQPGHVKGVIVMRGEDPYAHNPHLPPPA